MTYEPRRVTDTFGGKFVLALTLAIGLAVVIFAASSPAKLREGCRMVGKIQKCETPSPTPSETSWRIGDLDDETLSPYGGTYSW
ncbi:hypothetical protein LO772_33985 [Yinghuangia sp. ASG 101]|uniref:hypothetical protein n=1 Tax=Yinghuangia sp. ASG 101 TaxID=2896848 RepID=UPI001E6147EF|nr:hypothetical protein [Yinghuangia sp. ASG 101]UGQ11723.1 hypothetical protein LO772_33985 [Yinghuangia sp. ASG 101]